MKESIIDFYNNKIKILAENNSTIIRANDVYSKSYVPENFSEMFPLLSKQMESLLLLNDNSFRWEITLKDEVIPVGEFHLVEISNAVRYDEENTELFKDVIFNKPLKHVYVIDNHPYIGDGQMVFVLLFYETENNEIWMRNDNGELLKLDLDFSNYLYHLIDNLAIYNWQYFYVNARYKAKISNVVLEDLNFLNNKFKEIGFKTTFSNKLDDLSNLINIKK